MDDFYLLTIAIPTFNRSHSLSTLLFLLQKELRNVPNSIKIEILVSDNASNDATIDVLNSYQSILSSLEYFTQKENIGFDKNVLFLYKHARGKFVWFLSDDDRFLPGTIKVLVQTLKSTTACVIPLLQHTKLGSQLLLEQRMDQIPYEPVDTFISIPIGSLQSLKITQQETRLAVILLCSQLSSTVVKKIPFKQNITDAGGLMHCYIVNQVLIHQKSYFIPKATLILPGPKKSISKWFLDSVLFGTRLLYSRSDMKFSEKIIDLVSTQTAIFGLKILARRFYYPFGFIEYPLFSDHQILTLKESFENAYSAVEPYVDAVLDGQFAKNRARAFFSATFLLHTLFLHLLNLRDTLLLIMFTIKQLSYEKKSSE